MTAAADDDLILKITNLTKSFGPIRALRGVDFELRRGEIHALAGENGAGKSTLMNIIDGILRPDSGEIRLDGKPVTITSPAMAQKLGIGFVHQEIALCPDITVAENIFMAATNASRALLMDYASWSGAQPRSCDASATSIPPRWCARSRSRSSSWSRSPRR